jgi:hypothetical protein
MVNKRRKLWSGEVTQVSTPLGLEEGIFTEKDPHKIALALKRATKAVARRKVHPYQSAMSMLNFYINRAGKNLDADHLKVLDRAKDELRVVFNIKEE